MKTKHTKGPWKLSEGYLIGPDDNLVKISLRENSSAHVKEEEVANARLVAAAPELLEALLEIIETEVVLENIDTRKAMAAITKATGGQP